MVHETEFRFLQKALEKCHIRTLILDPQGTPDPHIDGGLRKSLGFDVPCSHTLLDSMRQAKSRIIYRFTDRFSYHYLFLLLSEGPNPEILLIGPYLIDELTNRQLAEQAELFNMTPEHLMHFHGNVPILPHRIPLYAMLDTFCETLWQGEDFTVVDIERENDTTIPLGSAENLFRPEDTLLNMQAMEQRYAFENELMRAVSLGQTHKAELLLSRFTTISFERRLADPVRNLKNYCIIMNTLLRKAAENGGVHPLYLDSTSATFARKIELLPSTEEVAPLMNEMYRTYCRLVKKNSMKHYSSPIQKAIAYIDTDLTADLSLSSLAAAQSINASYLSALFKQETGQTITDYVNHKRMMLATQLLSSTKIQIQTIAQQCGILDVTYFSKLFKKYTGKTPKEYRKTLHG